VVKLTASAHCIGHCAWTEAGDPETVDMLAEKHTKTGHPTATVMRPAP
jgi:hypothetical protein